MTTNELTIFIVDDDKNALELLSTLIQAVCPSAKIIGTATSIEKALEELARLTPQLVFLDVQLKDGLSFELIDKLDEIDFDVIFTTAHDQYALKAFQYAAVHYLLKPVDLTELKEALDRVIEDKNNNNGAKSIRDVTDFYNGKKYDKIGLPTLNGYEFVMVDEIIRCESSGNYTNFVLSNGEVKMVSKPLGHYEDLLKTSGFFRTHKKHLINFSCVSSWERGKTSTVVLSNKETVPVSYSKRDDFMFLLKEKYAF